jgi:hypothetical protein
MQNQTLSSTASVALVTHKADTSSDVVESAVEPGSFQKVLTGQLQAQQLNQPPSKKNTVKSHLLPHASARIGLVKSMLVVNEKKQIDIGSESVLQGVRGEEVPGHGVAPSNALKPIKIKDEENIAPDQDEGLKTEGVISTAANVVLLQVAAALLQPTATQTVDVSVGLSTLPSATSVANAKLYDLLKTSTPSDQAANAEDTIPVSNMVNPNAPLEQPFELAKLQPNVKMTDIGPPRMENDVTFMDNKPSVVKEGVELLIMPAGVQAESAQSAQQIISSNPVNAYPGKAGWNQEISQKIVWMIGAAEQSVTLTLNPPDMGPLQVVLHVRNAQAEATFTSDNALVRQALADGMDNLRDNLQQAGIQLGQANINAGHQSQSGFQQMPTNQRSEILNQPVVISQAESLVTHTTLIRMANSLVDTFA